MLRVGSLWGAAAVPASYSRPTERHPPQAYRVVVVTLHGDMRLDTCLKHGSLSCGYFKSYSVFIKYNTWGPRNSETLKEVGVCVCVYTNLYLVLEVELRAVCMRGISLQPAIFLKN